MDRYIDEQLFFRTLPQFEMDYRTEVQRHLHENTFRYGITWKIVRDELLPGYPLLKYCYEQHGDEYMQDWEYQSRAAQLGRRVAGVMGNICREIEDDDPCEHEHSYAQEKIMDKFLEQAEENEKYTPAPPTGRRWLKRSSVMVVPAKKKRTNYKVRATRILSDSIEHVKPGEYIYLYYSTIEDARRDQSLLHSASVMAGWLDGRNEAKYRMYASRVEEVKDADTPYRLKVTHLLDARERKIYT